MDLTDDDVNRLRIAVSRISRQLTRHVPDEGMTQTQISVLGTVARREHVSIGELADIEGLNPTMLSRVVGKLEGLGLIRRYTDVADQRVAHVAITPPGLQLQLKIKDGRTSLFAAHVAGLDADLRESLQHAVPALEALAEHLQSQAVSSR